MDRSKLLQQADWGRIGKGLLAFTVNRIRNYDWFRSDSALPQGKTADDIVQEVILKTIDGTRNWDPDKGPLEPWLRDQVKSIVDALSKSAAHRHTEYLSNDDKQSGDYLSSEKSVASDLFGSVLSPEDEIIRRDDEKAADESINALLEKVDKEPELVEIITTILECDSDKPREIAMALSVSVTEIYNRIKRLRRFAQKVAREKKEN